MLVELRGPAVVIDVQLEIGCRLDAQTCQPLRVVPGLEAVVLVRAACHRVGRRVVPYVDRTNIGADHLSRGGLWAWQRYLAGLCNPGEPKAREARCNQERRDKCGQHGPPATTGPRRRRANQNVMHIVSVPPESPCASAT